MRDRRAYNTPSEYSEPYTCHQSTHQCRAQNGCLGNLLSPRGLKVLINRESDSFACPCSGASGEANETGYVTRCDCVFPNTCQRSASSTSPLSITTAPTLCNQ